MPIAVEKVELREAERRDSTFIYEQPISGTEELETLRATAALSRSQDHSRTESVDSGIGGMATTGETCSTRKNEKAELSPMSKINEQTLMLIQKMQILDMKLQSMEAQLKSEQVQRLALEAKVVKLEKDNEQLKSVRAQAGKQLQSFAEIFYAETETIKLRSTNPSPHPSMAELRRSRTDSLSSSGSRYSRASRISNQSA